MTIEEYMKVVRPLEAPTSVAREAMLRDDRVIRFDQGASGLAKEAGEILGRAYRCKFYKEDITVAGLRENIREELGDIMWYFTQLMDVFDITFEEILVANDAKLNKGRYKEGFSAEVASAERDYAEEAYQAEREVILSRIQTTAQNYIKHDPVSPSAGEAWTMSTTHESVDGTVVLRMVEEGILEAFPLMAYTLYKPVNPPFPKGEEKEKGERKP